VLRRLISIAYFLEVGLLLVLVPWSAFWDRNYFAQANPAFQEILRNNYLRGAVSGLGIVNLLLGFNDLAALFAARRQLEPPPDRPREPAIENPMKTMGGNIE
jgi:hypothetical protein